MKVIGWKAWYADGAKHVGSTREEWEALPADGVLVVMLYYDEFVEGQEPPQRYRRIISGNDTYWISPGGADHIYGQSDDKPELVANRYPGASVKTGRFVDDHTFKQAQEEAMADHDYAPFED